MKYFGYQIAEDAICEVCNNGTRVQDVHHIFGRIGKWLLAIEGLIGLCRFHHDQAHAEKITKQELSDIHLKFMENGDNKRG
jgi:hypothetical protein